MLQFSIRPCERKADSPGGAVDGDAPRGGCAALRSCLCFALAQLQPLPPRQTLWWAQPEDGRFREGSRQLILQRWQLGSAFCPLLLQSK